VTAAAGNAGVLERAVNLRLLGRLDEAERTLREALAASPDDPDLLGELGWVLYLADRSAEGLAAAEAAIALAPGEAHFHQYRASLLSDMKRHDEAVQAAYTARSLRPQEPKIARTSARVLAAARRLPEAYEAARHAVALDPESSDAHFLVADIADDLRDRQTARRAYEEALRLDPQNAMARHDLAVLDINTGHPARGLRGLVEAGALDPTMPIVLQTITFVLWKLSWRLRMLFVPATIACVAASSTQPDEATWSARVAAAISLLAIGLLTWWTVHDLPAGTRAAVLAAVRTDRPLRITYFGMAACVLLFLAVTVTGIGVFAGFVWLVLGLLGVLALVVGAMRKLRRT
jgi:tetratricopeptide (TPR) repeat protein